MTEARANQYCLMAEFLLELVDDPQAPEPLRQRAASILKLAPAEVLSAHPAAQEA